MEFIIHKNKNLLLKTAVVILNFNGEKFLKQFLPSVVSSVAHREDVRVFVVDNASTDQSKTILLEEFPNVETIFFDKNYGFAEGYNKAIKQIEAKYVVLLNSDVQVDSDWLLPLEKCLDKQLDIVACQPKILAFHDVKSFEYAGAAGGFIDKYGYPFCRGRLFSKTEIDEGQYDDEIDCFWATGACLFIRREDYLLAGGLDAEFFAHMEEIDLCWRLRSRGKRIVCVPNSKVYHVGGGTLAVSNPRKTYLNFRNNLFLLYKNLPEKDLKKKIFLRKVLDGIAAVQFLLKGEWGNVKAVFRAHQDFDKNYLSFKEKRLENMSKLTQSNIAEIYQRSIVFDFFLKGKRVFSQLNF